MTTNAGGSGAAGTPATLLSTEVVLERILDAPRELVFKAFTEAERLAEWWGPQGFTNPVCELDLRVGGDLRIVMRDWDGNDYPMTGVFREIAPPERLVFSTRALDGAGNTLLEGQWHVTFAQQDGKTKLTVRASAAGQAAIVAQMLAGMEVGCTQSLEKLAGYLASA